MEEKTLEALRGSIEKWEKIAAGTGEDDGSVNCPLCQLFYCRIGSPNCQGCPVQKKSGHAFCGHTPYADWRRASDSPIRHLTVPLVADTPELVAAAKKELEFLKSLLPEAAT